MHIICVYSTYFKWNIKIRNQVLYYSVKLYIWISTDSFLWLIENLYYSAFNAAINNIFNEYTLVWLQ